MLTLAELERAAGVLRAMAVGSRIQAAVQPDRVQVVLTVYGGQEGDAPSRRHLVVSADPRAARVGLRADPAKGQETPPGFLQYLRAHVVGGRITAVRLVDGDRQLALDVACTEGAFTLLLAIFGRRSNLYVLDAEQRIAAALRPLAETRSELSIGDAWRSPAAPPRHDRSDRFAAIADADLLAEIERSSAEDERGDAHADLARRIERALRHDAKALDRKLGKLDRELAAAEADASLERQGELLKTALPRIRRGDREVVVRDFATGEEVEIALDPTLGPAENLERVFDRYRKAVRTLAKGGARLDAVKEARAGIAALEAALAAAAADPDPAALTAFAARPEVARLIAARAPAAPPSQRQRPRELRLAGRDVPASLAPRRYRTESGLEVWVGRSDAANDFLSTRLARGKDLFFHLDGAPGSHVILRTEGRDDPPSEAVLDACELAVHFSKQKNATRADVHVVPIRNVKKPKGAKPGLVMVHGGKSIHLRRSEARLERILAARIEE
jgi:predicted ribosome quality control (RQC) complex YloA/Tae2 family protein